MSRPPGDVRPAAIMLDGIELKRRCCIVCLGHHDRRVRVALGLWDGSTENKTVTAHLLADLISRGLDVEQSVPDQPRVCGGPGIRPSLKWGDRKTEECAMRAPDIRQAAAASRATIRRPWLEHWLETCRDLSALQATHPMMDAVIDEIDGRLIRVGDKWLADFASCNYLGFDLDREIIDAIPAYVDEWGTHPSWSRLLGSPILYEEIEQQLTELLGCEDSLVLPTITHIHMSVIPLLAASGTIFLDARAHKTIYDGCQIARARGAAVRRFRFEDPDHLDQLLREERDPTRLVCMDGVNSMTGNPPDLRAFAEVARRHGALLYVDDAHGFGVIGERSDGESCPYGDRGNSIVRYAGESYDNLILVGGFSKAYSSLLAFIACPTDVKNLLKVAAPPYLYSGPSPVASLATTLAGLKVNAERGDGARTRLWQLTDRVLQGVHRLGVVTPNRSGMPIVEIPLRSHERIDAVGRFLFDRGVYVTLAAYPLVPKEEVGFRVQLTAANTEAEVDTLLSALEELVVCGELQMVDDALEKAA
jgi:8-amino-7-oxononanoate synthase